MSIHTTCFLYHFHLSITLFLSILSGCFLGAIADTTYGISTNMPFTPGGFDHNVVIDGLLSLCLSSLLAFIIEYH
jgi:hypothetical protein